MTEDPEVTAEIIKEDGHFQPLPVEELKNRLETTGLNRYVYALAKPRSWKDTEQYFDPKLLALEALKDSCQSMDIEFRSVDYIIVFEDCFK